MKKKNIIILCVLVLIVIITNIVINIITVPFTFIESNNIDYISINTPEEYLDEQNTHKDFRISNPIKTKIAIKMINSMRGYKTPDFIFGQSPTGYISINYSNGDTYTIYILERHFLIRKNDTMPADIYYIVKPLSLRVFFALLSLSMTEICVLTIISISLICLIAKIYITRRRNKC